MRDACRWSALVLLVFAVGASAAEGPAVTRSAKSGAWSDAATWEEGQVPGAGSRVLILGEHTVTYDVKSDAVIRAINVAGTLTFSRDRDTLLNTGLIKIEAIDSFSENGFDCEGHFDEPAAGQPRATLQVGTLNEPIPAEHQAIIRLHGVEGLDPQSCPAIVCCGGRMDFHGAPLSRTWVKLLKTAEKGSKEVIIAEAPSGWRVGDQVVVTSTAWNNDVEDQSEARTIVEKGGSTGFESTSLIILDRPLECEHLGDGEYRGEVANLSRNVVVESADPAGVRGHTMYHRGSAGSISYAEFRHLGKKDTLGRYCLHFHLCGNTMRGSSVIGASIWDSHNRWLTIHGTNYLVVRDNVGYKSIGHGYFLEDGTEVFNILDRNLAVAARHGKRLPKQVLPFDENEGAGFWWANSHNTFTRNIAADCDRYGFRYEATPTSALKLVFPVLHADGQTRDVDIRTLPFVRFDGNEVHSSYGLYGVNLGEGVRGVGPDVRHPFVMRNTKIWNVHYGLRPQAPTVLVENLSIKSHYGIYHPNFDNHVYRNVTIHQTNTEPFNRGHDDDSVQHGVLAVDGLTFDGIRSGGMPLIQISDDNATGRAESHFRRVEVVNWKDNSREKAIVNLGGGPRPDPKTEKGVPIYLHDWFGSGRTAMVVSTRSPEFKADAAKFRAESGLTGDESRVADVTGVEFPEPLSPIDDQPPQSVITHVVVKPLRILLRGSVADNGEVKRVVVNGQDAKLDATSGEWEISFLRSDSGPLLIAAHSEDAAGNVERLVHQMQVQ